MFGFPEEGTNVVVSFAYGLPHKPFITQILPHDLSLPRVPKGDQVWQHSEACQQRVDADGNWLRQTDGKIQDNAIEREVESMTNTERYQSHAREVDGHSTEPVGGIKKIEALGALKLLSGGTASLAAVDDLHQATGRDLNLVVGQKHNATVGGDMREQIQGVRESMTKVSQRLQAPKTWLGSEGVNVLNTLRSSEHRRADEHRAGRAYPRANSGTEQRRRIHCRRRVDQDVIGPVEADHPVIRSSGGARCARGS